MVLGHNIKKKLKKVNAASLRHYHGNYLLEVRKITKRRTSLTLAGWSLNCDLHPGSPNYETWVLNI
jgi:hypothetical protein